MKDQTGTGRVTSSVGGVASPPDDGGHMGSYTVPSETMDQSSQGASGGETAQGSTPKSLGPKSRFSPVGIAVVVLVLLGVLLVALRVTL